jgi:hypothetical protein
MLRDLGRPKAGSILRSPSQSQMATPCMVPSLLLDVAGAPKDTILGCSMATGSRMLAMRSPERRCCFYTGPGLVLSLIPWCWNRRLTGESRRLTPLMVPLRHGKGGRSFNMHALIALRAAFRNETCLATVLEGPIG